jgi:hypothetical protein
VAIEGDLKDMSLMNLVQFICQDGLNTALFLTCQNEDGVIYFDRGEPVHATTGALEGDEAVYRLLEWTEGAFRVTSCVTIPRRTVATSWNNLILEGMRRNKEKKKRSAKPQTEMHIQLTQAEIEQDSSLENDLVLLLSRLEHSRARLFETRSRRQPSYALGILTNIVHQIMAFSKEHPYMEEAPAIPLTGLENSVPGADLKKIENGLLSGQIVTLYNSWKGDLIVRREIFRQVGSSIISMLQTFFSALTNCFRSSSKADQWIVICSDFVADLTHAVEKVEF